MNENKRKKKYFEYPKKTAQKDRIEGKCSISSSSPLKLLYLLIRLIHFFLPKNEKNTGERTELRW